MPGRLRSIQPFGDMAKGVGSLFFWPVGIVRAFGSIRSGQKKKTPDPVLRDRFARC